MLRTIAISLLADSRAIIQPLILILSVFPSFFFVLFHRSGHILLVSNQVLNIKFPSLVTVFGYIRCQAIRQTIPITPGGDETQGTTYSKRFKSLTSTFVVCGFFSSAACSLPRYACQTILRTNAMIATRSSTWATHAGGTFEFPSKEPCL
jgi:hypothetical protein